MTPISEERRLVTVLFVDMVGFTSRSESSDPELVREVQRAYFEAVAGQVERYGGIVEKYIGDAVMAIYGAPRAHDDDAERALHAALGIRDAVRTADADVEVRIGVNTGEVVGGAGAGPQSGEYTVTGDAVNVAARLQQAAEPGVIFVGATTRRLAAEAFDFAPVTPLELKGKSEPVEAWRLVRALPERPRTRGGESPLVGRRRELLLLEAALESALEGSGLIVGLSGEAGIGKSRMALEFRNRAEAAGFETTWASSQSYASSFPFHMVEQLADQLLARRGDGIREALVRSVVEEEDVATLDRWAAALADVAGEADPTQRELLADVTPAARQRLLVQALRALLEARADRSPQLVVLDDLHWADASSLSVLDEVLGAVPGHRIVVLALYRPGWVNPWSSRSSYQQVNLDRLRDAEARELVQALSVGGRIDEGRAAELLHRSGGNPFFLEELLRSAAPHGAVSNEQLPATVHELLLARIDALPPDARNVLQLASVIGMAFSERLLTAIEPDADVPAALAALQRDDLIVARSDSVDEAEYALRHPLVHEVAYRSLLMARRRVLHRRIGEWLEAHRGEDALAEMAAHFRDGDDVVRARALLARAADRAARLNAPWEARDLYLQAAELSGDDIRHRAEMLGRAAHLTYLVGEVTRAVDIATESVQLYERSGDRVRALDSRRLLGRYLWMDGRGRSAETEIMAAVEGLEELPPSPELALAYSYRAQLRMLMPDFPMGEAFARKAIEVAEEVGSVEAMVHALNNLGTSLVGMGDESGVGHLRRSLELALEHNMPDDAGRAYANLSAQGAAGMAYLEPDEAQALLDEMLAYDQRVAPGGAFEQWHLGAQAELWIAHGRWDDAERLLVDLETLADPNRYLQVDIAADHALLRAFRGRYEEAAALLRPWVAASVEINDLQAYGTALVAIAHVDRGLGNAAAAVDAIDQGIRLRGDTQESDISAFYLFESVDVLTWMARDPSVERTLLERGLVVVNELATVLAADADRGGPVPVVRIRNAYREAATAQLRRLRERGADDASDLAAMLTHADVFRRSRFAFAAARVEQWVAEATGDQGARDRARATFSELRAAPYLARLSE